MAHTYARRPCYSRCVCIRVNTVSSGVNDGVLLVTSTSEHKRCCVQRRFEGELCGEMPFSHNGITFMAALTCAPETPSAMSPATFIRRHQQSTKQTNSKTATADKNRVRNASTMSCHVYTQKVSPIPRGKRCGRRKCSILSTFRVQSYVLPWSSVLRGLCPKGLFSPEDRVSLWLLGCVRHDLAASAG